MYLWSIGRYICGIYPIRTSMQKIGRLARHLLEYEMGHLKSRSSPTAFKDSECNSPFMGRLCLLNMHWMWKDLLPVRADPPPSLLARMGLLIAGGACHTSGSCTDPVWETLRGVLAASSSFFFETGDEATCQPNCKAHSSQFVYFRSK